MPSCPVCRGKVPKPMTTWSKLGAPDQGGVMARYTIGTFRCHQCKKVFDQALQVEKVKFLELSVIEGYERRLKLAEEERNSLSAKLKEMEEIKASLESKLAELDEGLAIAKLESKASALEGEVAVLRETRNTLAAKLNDPQT